jgi:hypothetical protein
MTCLSGWPNYKFRYKKLFWEAVMNLKEALAKIEELEEQIADLEMENDDLQQDKKDDEEYGDLYLEDDDCPDLDEDPRYMELRDFIRDIGFDPEALPSSLGDRMAICGLIEAARAMR